MQSETRLFTIYTRVDPYLYGAISIIGPEDIARGGTIPLEWSYPFVISKQMDDREIVYGSLLHLIGEVAKPIFRFNHRVRALADSLPEEVRSSIRVSHEGNAVIHELQSSDFPEWLLHRQEELTKEGLLLSGLHLRTLLEILSGRRNASVPVYDYDGNANGAVTLNELFHILMHHRYCVVSGDYIHDVFSGKAQLESPRLFGSKVKSSELFNAMLSYISTIKIRDLVGVLRGRLESLTVQSEPRDIMFAVQNVHSLTEIIGERIPGKRFPKMQELLFREFTTEEKRQIEEAKRQDKTVTLVRRFGQPAFKIDPALHEKRIEMSININGKSESFSFEQDQFFGVLTQVYGDDPVVSLDKLMEIYNKPEI